MVVQIELFEGSSTDERLIVLDAAHLVCPACGSPSFLWHDAHGWSEIQFSCFRHRLTVIESYPPEGSPDYRIESSHQIGCTECGEEWARLRDLISESGVSFLTDSGEPVLRVQRHIAREASTPGGVRGLLARWSRRAQR
jgi:hypothetical protein